MIDQQKKDEAKFRDACKSLNHYEPWQVFRQYLEAMKILQTQDALMQIENERDIYNRERSKGAAHAVGTILRTFDSMVRAESGDENASEIPDTPSPN